MNYLESDDMTELENAALFWYETRKAFLDAEFTDLKYECERKRLFDSCADGSQALAESVRRHKGDIDPRMDFLLKPLHTWLLNQSTNKSSEEK